MIHTKKTLLLSLCFCLVVSCASQSKHKRLSDINFVSFSDYIGDPIELIHQRLSKKLTSVQLQELVNWSLGQSKAAQEHLKEQVFLKEQFYYFDGDYSKAINYYEQALNIDPTDFYIQTRYAISLVRIGKLDTSQRVLEEIYKNQKTEKVGLLLAGVLVSLDNIDKAQGIYKEILSKNNKSKEACLFLGKSLARQKKTSQAINRLKKCMRFMPKASRFPLEVAKLNANRGHFKTSKIYLKKALKLDPSLSQAVLMLGSFEEKKGNDSKAYQIYSRYLKKHPQDYLILNKLASWHFDREESDEAIPYIERLVDIDDSNSNLRVRLGILYVENRMYSQAIDLFNEYLENNKGSEKVHYYLAAVYQEVEKFQQAIHHYSQISNKSSLFEDSVLQIASILSYLAGEEPEEYEQKFFAHYDQYGESGKFQLELGIIKAAYFESEGMYEDAVTVMTKLKKRKLLQESHTFYLISLYEKDKNYVKVDQELMEMIEKNPKNAKALNFLGYSYLERGINLKQAYHYISKALELRPRDGYIRDSMGWYYYLQGNYQKALTYLKKAYNDSGSDEEVALHLAETYQALGQFKRALSYYQKVLKKNKNEETRARVAESMERMIKLQNAKRLPASQK